MRLYALILAVCVLRARCASVNRPEKRLDDLDNIDLDNETEPEIIDQPDTIKDVDNNLRKEIGIPVKIIEEPIKVIDENSNDYVPDNDDSTNIKRLELDLKNPGLPQRQEHETQNPELYGEGEKAIIAIKRSILNAQEVFKKGIQDVNDSLKSLFGNNENIPAVQENIKNLRNAFIIEIEKVNATVKSHSNPYSVKSAEVFQPNPNIKYVDAGLKSLEKNFKNGIDTISEGLEVLTILREEDEAQAKAEAENPEGQKPEEPKPTPAPVNTNPMIQYMNSFTAGVQALFTNITSAVQNNFNPQNNAGGSKPPSFSFPNLNFFQGINLPNLQQGQGGANAGQASGESKPQEGAQADTPVAPAPPATPAPWTPAAIFQNVQQSLGNIFNGGQNNQQAQQNPPQQGGGGFIANAFQNIAQVWQGQGQGQGQAGAPAKPEAAQPAKPEAAQPAKPEEKPSESAASSSEKKPADEPVKETAPVQNNPIQNLVQNNPIVKGIQNAVNRIQGVPNPETPRNEIVNEEIKEESADAKGHIYPGTVNNQNNQGDNNDSGRIDDKEEAQKIEDLPAEKEKEVIEEIKPEETKTPSLSDKTE